MIEIKRKVSGIFQTGEVWFSESPRDLSGYHSLTFRQCRVKGDFAGFERSDFTTLVIDLTQDEDSLWQNLSPKSCRYKINRGMREGITISVSDKYEEFERMYTDFAEQKKLGDSGYTIEQLRKDGTLFFAEYENQTIAGQLYLEDKDGRSSIRLLLGCSRRLDDDKEKSKIIGFANRYLVWEAMKYAKGKGITEFDFGGFYTGSDPDPERENINTFKKSFGGELVTHYDYKKAYSSAYKFVRALYRFVHK